MCASFTYSKQFFLDGWESRRVQVYGLWNIQERSDVNSNSTPELFRPLFVHWCFKKTKIVGRVNFHSLLLIYQNKRELTTRLILLSSNVSKSDFVNYWVQCHKMFGWDYKDLRIKTSEGEMKISNNAIISSMLKKWENILTPSIIIKTA